MDKILRVNCESTLKIDYKALKPFQGDLKSIDKDKFNDLKESLKKHGLPFALHVYFDKGDTKIIWCIDGHHRLLAFAALESEGWHIPKIPCVQILADSKQEAAKLLLVGNAKYAEMSNESLSDYMINYELDLTDLEHLDIPDVDLSQFELEEAPTEGLTDQDEVPDVEKSCVTLGDIYELGNHRLICADSTKIENIEKLMNGEKADVLCWDPPWNLNFKYNTYQDDKTENEYLDFITNCVNNFYLIANENNKCFVFQAEKNWLSFNKWFCKYSPRIFSVCKNFVQMSGGIFNIAWDPVLFWQKGKKEGKNGGKNYFLSNTASTSSSNPERIPKGSHPCPRQVDAIEWILSFCDNDKHIVDFCGGSGTTLIACEKTNRKCFMAELDPHYCSVIIERWQNFTGKIAFRLNKDGSKTSYNELKSA